VSLSIDPSVSALSFEVRPSYWFTWHASWVRPGSRVLDVACGSGRHAIAAAELGARVVAIDRDPVQLDAARREAARRGLSIEWIEADLERTWPELGQFDAVLVFNYLDRARMDRVVAAVGSGGVLMLETFLEIQRQLGWGPKSDAHLLRFGEITGLVAPLEVIHAREAFEPADEAQWAALGSVLAHRRK
jgi:2-polyprenyl-3-methyl-5-hydroxy-6-metoxy-1,4-benzoquinol methylase